jgi:hypothetical protein
MKKDVNAANNNQPAASKTTVKKTATKKDTVIKYADKSVGQPVMVEIFDKLKALLQSYAKAPLVAQDGTGGMYNLVSNKPVEILGKERELFFASAMVQKGYVGFYFFPIYTDPGIASVLSPELLKCLKGKSCFHIKKDDPVVMEQVKDALDKGYELYKEKGWL